MLVFLACSLLNGLPEAHIYIFCNIFKMYLWVLISSQWSNFGLQIYSGKFISIEKIKGQVKFTWGFILFIYLKEGCIGSKILRAVRHNDAHGFSHIKDV